LKDHPRLFPNNETIEAKTIQRRLSAPYFRLWYIKECSDPNVNKLPMAIKIKGLCHLLCSWPDLIKSIKPLMSDNNRLNSPGEKPYPVVES